MTACNRSSTAVARNSFASTSTSRGVVSRPRMASTGVRPPRRSLGEVKKPKATVPLDGPRAVNTLVSGSPAKPGQAWKAGYSRPRFRPGRKAAKSSPARSRCRAVSSLRPPNARPSSYADKGSIAGEAGVIGVRLCCVLAQVALFSGAAERKCRMRVVKASSFHWTAVARTTASNLKSSGQWQTDREPYACHGATPGVRV